MIESIQWIINGTRIENLPPSEGTILNSTFNTEFEIGILEFNNLTMDYNMSRIRCTTDFGASSIVVMLLVKGLAVPQFY